MFKLSVIVFLEIASVVFIAAQNKRRILNAYSEYSVPCTTPNGDEGECVEVQKCELLINAVTSKKKSSYNFIHDSRCGPINNNARLTKVCCGQHDHYLNKEETTKELPSLPERGLFPEECGVQGTVMRIMGGVETGIGEHPWLARLRHRRYNGEFNYGCSGFLISEIFVLTAAHCVASDVMIPLGPLYQVQLGEHDTRHDSDCNLLISAKGCADPPQLLRTAEPIVHPNYSNDRQHHNDIAVIPLRELATFTDYVRPICLARTHSQTPNLLVAGWGKTEKRDSSYVKRQVMLPRVDRGFCSFIYSYSGVNILNSQFCAGGEQGRDACQGDSGGPIMVLLDDTKYIRWYAEGIASLGRGCGLKDWPGVYTSIPYFMPWIEMMMNQYLNEKKPRIKMQESENLCTTPNNETAQCVSIYSCPVLKNSLTTNLNPEKVRFLRESQCGYNKHPYVCCGSVDDYQKTFSKR